MEFTKNDDGNVNKITHISGIITTIAKCKQKSQLTSSSNISRITTISVAISTGFNAMDVLSGMENAQGIACHTHILMEVSR
jgi:hypothetical protein